jgi:hypothetical protein
MKKYVRRVPVSLSGVTSAPGAARLVWLGAMLAPLACGAPDAVDSSDGTVEPPSSSTSEELTRERNGTLIFTAENRLDYNRTFRGYAASLRYNGNASCSGAMIGPNVMMTASHCGAGDATIDFFMHVSNDKYANFQTDRYSCQRLLRMHDDTDLMLYWCPAKDGVNPGDKYGYLDFEVSITTTGMLDVARSLERAVVDTPVRVFWWNNLVEPTAVSRAILVSEGMVTSRAETTGWPSIQGGCNSTPAPIMRTNVWVKSGVSGSSTLSAKNRIVGGPTTLASGSADGDDTLTTNAIVDYLTRTVVYSPTGGQRCDGGGGSQLNGTLISSLGLDPADYAGAVDKNNNGLFDLHEDAEAGRLLTASSYYWLGFESNRRNKAWSSTTTPAPGFSISATDENGGTALLRNGTAITHRTLNLTDGALYQLRGRLTFLGTGSLPISSGTEPLGPPLATLSGSTGVQRFAVNLEGRGAPHVLQFGPASIGSFVSPVVLLADVTLARKNATYTFRGFDERLQWRTDAGKNALFLPVGVDESSSLVDFSMAVRPGAPTGSAALFFGASSNQLCFSRRKDPRLVDPEAGPNPNGIVKIRDAGGIKLNLAFNVTNSWVDGCMPNLPLDPATAEVWFEAVWGGYLVDNVRMITVL